MSIWTSSFSPPSFPPFQHHPFMPAPSHVEVNKETLRRSWWCKAFGKHWVPPQTHRKCHRYNHWSYTHLMLGIYIYIHNMYIYGVYKPWQSLLSSSKVHPKSIKVDSTSVAVGFIIVPSDHPKITLLLPRQGVLFSSWMAMHHGIFCETTCKQRRAILFMHMYMIYDNCWKAQINIVKVQNGSETSHLCIVRIQQLTTTFSGKGPELQGQFAGSLHWALCLQGWVPTAQRLDLKWRCDVDLKVSRI